MVLPAGLRCFILLSLSSTFVASMKYRSDDKVRLYVNKVGPHENPHETYHYYQLPLCRPEKIVHKSLSLGEVLDGDRMAESLYDIKFKQNRAQTDLCETIPYQAKALQELIKAIEENYYFEFVMDELPIRNFIGRLEEEGIVPHTHKVFIYTHHHFIFEYNDNHIITARIDLRQQPAMRLDDKVAPFQLKFTYSVEWRSTSVTYEERDKSRDQGFFPKSLEIHWLSVINSTLLVFLLLGFVILILFRVVRNDLNRYNQQDVVDKDDQLENGWKVIHTDVFRFPRNSALFCSILGVGTQLLTCVTIILLITSFKLINVHRHGLINATALILYAFTSGIAGYVSAKMYKQLNGHKWVTLVATYNVHIWKATFIFQMGLEYKPDVMPVFWYSPWSLWQDTLRSAAALYASQAVVLVPMFFVWCVENSFFWGYQSTQALPWQTVLLLVAIWLLIGYPLSVVGGVLGKNFGGRYASPCRTRNIPRELPSLSWYHSCFAYCLVGGFLPFSAISVESYYIFSTVWGHEAYTLFGILFIVFGILLSVTACVAVALTYFQLAAEDYRWWWRSVFVGGSTALFVFAYAIFFYLKRSQLSGLLQSVQYFCYVAIICYAFFLSLGTIAFFASQRFVRYIYTNVKTD